MPVFTLRPFAPLCAAVIAACAIVVGASACESAPAGPPPSRFNAAKKATQAQQASTSFCEASFAGGEQGRAFAVPAEKALPVGEQAKALAKGQWRWVNLWATWCRPCVEEFALLSKWQGALAKDGIPVSVELYSVDDDASDLSTWLKKNTSPAGTVRWLAGGSADLPKILDNLGVPNNSPIPVHALIDPDGHVRCARVGAVHEQDYAAIKAILSGA